MVDALKFAVVPAEQFREQLAAPPLSAKIFPFGIGIDLKLLRANVFERPQDVVSSIFQPGKHIHLHGLLCFIFTCQNQNKSSYLRCETDRAESKHLKPEGNS